MQNNKLIKFLKKLDEQEIKEFKTSYMDRLHSKNSIPNLLLKYLQKHHPEFPKEKLQPEKVYKIIFKDSNFSQDKINKAISDLRGELKLYLIRKYQDEFPFERDLILLQLYEKYNLKPHFDLHLKSMLRDVKKEKLHAGKWLKKMRIAHEGYFDPKKEQIDQSDEFLIEANENLDQFYALSKLQYACELHNRSQVIQGKTSNINFTELISNPSIQNYSPLHKSFFLAYQLFLNRSEQIYLELKKTVFKNIRDFSLENQHILLTYLINHNSYKKKKGLPFSRKELFEIYQFGINSEMFIKDGIFNSSHFNNIVDLGCKQKELKWLEHFIERWSIYLAEEIRDPTIQISKAFIHFEKKEFGKVTDILNKHNFKGVHNKLRFRFLEIAAKYELGEKREHIISLCQTSKKFARRSSELGNIMGEGLYNFSKFVEKLLSPKLQVEKIKAEFEKKEFIYFEDWLKEKVSQIS